MAQLARVQRQTGLFDKYIAQNCEVLVLKEKIFSLSGDSFDITLQSGQPLFKIKGKHLTISGRKSMYDMSDNHLFDIVKEHLHIHTTFAVEDPQKKKLMEVKSKFKLVGSKAMAEFTTKDGRTETLVMEGNWRDTTANITNENTKEVVARIDRKWFNAREFFGGQQTYALIVAPGVDMALMVALCVALDEKNNEASAAA